MTSKLIYLLDAFGIILLLYLLIFKINVYYYNITHLDNIYTHHHKLSNHNLQIQWSMGCAFITYYHSQKPTTGHQKSTLTPLNKIKTNNTNWTTKIRPNHKNHTFHPRTTLVPQAICQITHQHPPFFQEQL